MIVATSRFRVLGLCLASAGFGEIFFYDLLTICLDVSVIKITASSRRKLVLSELLEVDEQMSEVS